MLIIVKIYIQHKSSEYENMGAREPKLLYTENGSHKIKKRELPYLLSKIAWHTGYIICRNHSIIFVKFVSQ